MTSAEGSFASPGYPSAYHHSAECVWDVRVARGSRIRFLLVDIDLVRKLTLKQVFPA